MMKAEDVREVAAIEAWCISRGDFERAMAEWPNMLAIDKEHYYALADGIIATIAPLIAAAEREACARIVETRAPHAGALGRKETAAAIRSRTGDK